MMVLQGVMWYCGVMVRCDGVARCGVVRCDVVRCDVVRCDGEV